MSEKNPNQSKYSWRYLLFLIPPAVVVLSAILLARLGDGVGSAQSVSDGVIERTATYTPFWEPTDPPTETPTPEPSPTPEPTATPIGPPVALDDYERLFAGVYYKRQQFNSPRRYIAHIVVVELNKRNIKLMVTPEDALGQPTSAFLQSYGLALAINGDGWVGDSYDPLGFAASEGEQYSEESLEPTIYIAKNGKVKLGGSPPPQLWNAISGSHLLVKNGQITPRIKTCGETEIFCQNLTPRTSVGISEGNYLIIVVVEGLASERRDALTLPELAQLHLKLGSVDAIAMDGGGSSTLVVQTEGGFRVLNNPSDGSERPVANHLGIYAPQISGE